MNGSCSFTARTLEGPLRQSGFWKPILDEFHSASREETDAKKPTRSTSHVSHSLN